MALNAKFLKSRANILQQKLGKPNCLRLALNASEIVSKRE
jgi:hypothetical protein